MRALGPGSVSSLLKIALDVAYWLLWAVAGAALLGLVSAFFIPLDDISVTVDDAAGLREVPLSRVLLVFGLAAGALYFGGFVVILHRLRRIFRTLTIGDPFQPDNVRRLREIGLVLAVVTGGSFLSQMVMARIAPGVVTAQGVSDLLTPVFSILVVFVLAEVFREGARLRHESELTI